MTRAFGWLAAALLAFVLSPMALAQDTNRTADPTADRTAGPTVLLDLGFNGMLPAERWAPVRVIVSAMEEPVQAVATIGVSTHSGEVFTTLVPIATTPGRETIVPATVWVPPSIAGIRVELRNENGSALARSAYGTVPGTQAIALESPTAMPIILGVGTPSLRLAFGVNNYEREFVGTAGERLRARASAARVASAVPPAIGRPPWLPTDAMAYQGLTAVVVDGSLADRLEPGGLGALREWVTAGGRLLLVNADNNALRLILGDRLPAGLHIGQPTNAPLPSALGGPARAATRPFDPQNLPVGWEVPPASGGLVAIGPVGLGMVALVGFDPDLLADRRLIAETETAWHGTLAPLIMDDLERGRAALGGGREQFESLESVSAIAAINWVSRAPAVGTGAFMAIFAMMLALAITLGPIDRLLLKRLGSLHRWWLTALAWIALATAGAWLVPTRVRSGPTTVGSIRVVDAWQDPTGRDHAWQATVSGFFMNRSASIALDDLESTSWLSPMAHPWQYANMGSLTMISTGAAPEPRPTDARLWTTRTFRQAGPTTAPVAARVTIDDGRYEIRLRGPMAGAADTVAVRTGGRWLGFRGGAPSADADGARTLNATRGDLTMQAPREFDASSFTTTPGGGLGFVYEDPPRRPPPWLIAMLTGPIQRGPAFEAMGDTDEWAVVYLSWIDDQPLIGTGVGEIFETTWVCRLAVPVERIP